MLHIIDDESIIRESLAWLAKSRAIDAITYDSAEAFLQAMQSQITTAPEGECILLDVRMAGTSGITLFHQLSDSAFIASRPVIFLTGHGDVPMAVDMLKNGAFDFFEKPFNDNQLMDRVLEAMAASREAVEQVAIRQRLDSLSQREKEVLDLILDGKLNKIIADTLGISMRTVEVHRSHIFEKMNVKTAVELARLLK